MKTFRSARVSLALSALASLWAVGCADFVPLGPCEPAQTEVCSCPGDVASVRICRFTGTFSPCLCGAQTLPEPPFDGGVFSASVDGGVSLDTDGGAAEDAGSADAGLAEGGRADGGNVDAGARDGGLADAGLADAGLADGGARDGGLGADAGLGVTYRAYAPATAINRIFVYKSDSFANRCTTIVLAQVMAGGIDLVTPSGWRAENAFVTDRATDCVPPPHAPSNRFTMAVAAQGTVAFSSANATGFPCTVDVRAVLRFGGIASWAPGTDRLSALAIPVENVMCP